MEMGKVMQKPAPSVPSAKQAATSKEEFDALKKSFSIESWEMSPNNWDAIQIIFTSAGTEQQARSFLSAIELATPEM